MSTWIIIVIIVIVTPLYVGRILRKLDDKYYELMRRGEMQYDEIIKTHYKQQAGEHGLRPTCSMEDQYVREKETEAILEFMRKWRSGLQVVDVGCGNGYTLSVLQEVFPDNNYTGCEMSIELIKLAKERFSSKYIPILCRDIRHIEPEPIYDVLICQRVLINILDYKDQLKALENIINMVRPGGKLLFIEAFARPLINLNIARMEVDLPAIKVPEHNLYLPDKFFEHPKLKQYYSEEFLIPANFLSTHYFVSRVFHPLIKDKKNSRFVEFFSDALNNVGDYSPIKLYTFTRG